MKAIRRIVLALDASKRVQKASKLAIDLAKSLGARLIIACVVPRPKAIVPPMPLDSGAIGFAPAVALPQNDFLSKIAEKKLAEIVAEAKRRKVKTEGRVLKADSVAKTIMAYAGRQRADLIIVGMRPTVGMKRIVSPNEMEDVVAKARCPVVIP